ncbi:MAG TPA: PSD1 and planctomycete cytochrome C domain-containing protein [Vicinamibacterales bacterium]|nr:PSD1 and planctomycete cytochrome C domain-containing protein [Vicinamibacterales bacterium]
MAAPAGMPEISRFLTFARRAATAALIALIAGRVAAARQQGSAPQSPVDFARDIQPILEARCYECHGPKKARNGLRLDLRAAAFRGGDSGSAIVPGDSERSLLVRRIRGLDGEEPMPKDAEPLTAPQIALIRAWIDQGAAWPGQPGAEPAAAGEPESTHWAYVRPVAAHPPAAGNAAWPRNDIDRFVLARLEKERLPPSSEAAFETLVRRVSLDLIGLPPTLAELDAALADAAANGRDAAYEHVVDRLLASPHYGERWARPWLDLARYADSHGYEKDRLRVMWKYRDWVIDALNADMPFDRFTIEQIAGDMLPGATEAQRIASGFHRNTMLNQEGGIDVEEARWETLVDRVNTTATVWLGSTLGCAQCHNHKYDPFTQRDFYRMLAFFENVEYTIAGQAGGDRFADEPQISLPTAEQETRRKALQAELDKHNASLRADSPARAAAQARWEQSLLAAERAWIPLTVERFDSSGGSTGERLADKSVLVSGPNPAANTYTVAARAPVPGITAIRIEALPDARLPGGGPGRDPYGNFVLSALTVTTGNGASVPLAPIKTDDGSVSSAGWVVDATRDPAGRVRRQGIFVADRPLGAAGAALQFSIVTTAPVGQGLGRFRLSVTTSPSPLRAVSVAARLRPSLLTPRARRTEQQTRDLAARFRAVSPLFKTTRDRVEALQKSLRELGIVSAMVMKEKPGYERPSTWVRRRGAFLDRAEQVYAAVPSFLPALPDDVMPNRLGLARWLVDERNPLTARVTVNRAWEQFFGRGLVETSEDFGSQGAAPSHPDLLDWLAVTFVKQGWRLKPLHRLIVMSATYRQASAITPPLAERDPDNRLFARGPRFRVEAEMVRDIGLTASGLLSRRIGGPSVFPPQPDGIWQNPYSSDRWVPSTGEDRYRRGLYTFLRRTAPYPAFTTFDSTSREACTVRRVRTNTPLQALTMLNDEAFFEMAGALGRRMMTEPEIEPSADPVRVRAAYGFRLVTSRAPKPQELDLIVAMFRRHPDWTLVANALLNLDETITKE